MERVPLKGNDYLVRGCLSGARDNASGEKTTSSEVAFQLLNKQATKKKWGS
jgi:hypothetical protein